MFPPFPSNHLLRLVRAGFAHNIISARADGNLRSGSIRIHEMANTRIMLERIPDDKLTWKPHPKSWDMAHLAQHLATVPSWGASTLTTDSLDFTGYQPPPPPESRDEVLAEFDKGVASARAALASAGIEALRQNWSLSANGKTFLTMPRIAVMRSFVMNHAIHHRAQLGVYLRLNDIPVPAIYGPSADEGSM
jgi:uncharacterized damage-inducible protein DinB